MNFSKTNTRDKLDEASYFLEQMKFNISDRSVFRHNLSAFVSAARSVTFVMQKEFDKIEGFKIWYNSVQLGLKNSSIMRLLVEKRDLSIHEKPAKPRGHVTQFVHEGIGFVDYVKVIKKKPDGTVEITESEPTSAPPKTQPISQKTTQWKWYFDDYPQQDVISISEEQLVTLEKLVNECEKQFTKKNNQ